MDIQLICMDLDGTALLDDRNSFSPRLHAALKEAHRRGTAIVPVTGRQFKLLPQAILQKPEWLDLVVLCNGGQIRRFATGEVLMEHTIEEKALRQLLALAEKYDLPIEFSVDSTYHLTASSLEKQQADPGLVFHRDTILANHSRLVDSLEPVCTQRVEKVNLLCIPETLQRDLVKELKQMEVSAVFASRNSMEITHPKADKGSGLEALCALLNVPLENTLAIGDSGNDLAMLKRAGMGVAMGNAPDFVKAAADAVTADNCHDGAAQAIDRYVLSLSRTAATHNYHERRN